MATQTIVVSNHEELYLEMIKDILEAEGYERVFCMVKPSIEDIARLTPSLLLLDIHFGDADYSWQLTNRCKLHRTLKSVPIILCATDPRLFAAKAAMLAAQGISTLEKPFLIETLLEAVAARIGPPASTH